MIEYENLKDSNAPFSSEIKEALSKVVDSGWYVLGSEVESFECEFSQYIGSKYCIGVANGLDALTLSLLAFDMPNGSEVLVSSNTYIATILAILNAGFKPVLVEPNIHSYNIDHTLLEKYITTKTAAISVTHLYGKSCEMTHVMEFAVRHGLKVVEDCAQSHGAKWDGRTTGTFGDTGCFSFYPTKNLGGLGDAGAIVTNNETLADKLRYLRNYGSKQKYVNKYIGYNSRLDEIQAAVLRVKLKYLDKITNHKRMLADIYFNNLSPKLILPSRSNHEFDVFHIFAIRHKLRDDLKAWLLQCNIKTEIHYPIPPHSQTAMRDQIHGDYPVSDEIHKTILSLPISYSTTAADAIKVCDAVNNFPDL